jgi:hypothetical protein
MVPFRERSPTPSTGRRTWSAPMSIDTPHLVTDSRQLSRPKIALLGSHLRRDRLHLQRIELPLGLAYESLLSPRNREFRYWAVMAGMTVMSTV